MPLTFDNTYARLPELFYARVAPTPVKKPELLAANAALAEELGSSAEEIGSAEYVEALGGSRILSGSEPLALAYAGHQFGHFVPSLGDGRAVLLGEALARDGRRFDVQLKGAGRTPFSRGGDGRATLGSVLREYIVSEAMAALGVPTTRSLAVVATGEIVPRERPFPGAVLTRVASSHIRVGTFEYFSYRHEHEALARLAEYAFVRHVGAEVPPEGLALGLLDHVIERQAELVARWMGLGFVHGVMNTDNCTISGETIDYGPCAFLDGFQPNRVFSSIDQGGRYAYDQQPGIARWNMMRLGIALAPLLDVEPPRITEVIKERLVHFEERFAVHFNSVWRAKLGCADEREDDEVLVRTLLTLLARHRADFTTTFRRLYDVAEGERSKEGRFLELFAEGDTGEAREWLDAWRARFDGDGGDEARRLSVMKRANPAFVPRNHLVEEAIDAANEGDLAPFERLTRLVRTPFDLHPEADDLLILPGVEQWSYRTFCGT